MTIEPQNDSPTPPRAPSDRKAGPRPPRPGTSQPGGLGRVASEAQDADDQDDEMGEPGTRRHNDFEGGR